MRLGRPRVSRRAAVACLVAAPWAVWALVRGFGLDSGHLLVGAMAFTPYAAATACIPVLLALTLRAWIVSGVALAAGLALALAVLPRAIDGPHVAGPRDPGRRLVVMTSNQLVGHGDARTIVRLVREHHVDVLSLQELTPEAVTRLDAAGIRRLLPGRALIAELVLPT